MAFGSEWWRIAGVCCWAIMYLGSVRPGVAEVPAYCGGVRANEPPKKIIQGWTVGAEKWPGLVALRYNNDPNPNDGNDGQKVYFCGGVMIDKRTVLTAAHCVMPYLDNKDADGRIVADFSKITTFSKHGFKGKGRVEAVIGVSDLKAKIPASKVYQLEVGGDWVDPTFREERERAGWSGCGAVGCAAVIGHDIGMLRLDREYDGPVARLGRRNGKDDPPGNREYPVMVAGFGRTSVKDEDVVLPFPKTNPHTLAASFELRETSIPMAPLNACRARYKTFGLPVFDNQICAADHKLSLGGRDSCHGDSGSPLVAFDNKRCPYVVGVTSWGSGCAEEGNFGVYMKVSSFINRIMRPGSMEGAKPTFVSARDAVDFGLRDRVWEAAEKLVKLKAGDSLEVGFCQSGVTSTCDRVGALPPAAIDTMGLRFRDTAHAGPLIVFVVYRHNGAISQLWPRKRRGDLNDEIRAGEFAYSPPRGRGRKWDFDWLMRGAMLIAVRLPPSETSSRAMWRRDHLMKAARSKIGAPDDNEAYVAALAHELRTARGGASMVSRIVEVATK